jgi:hypothetical protein
MYLTFTLSKSVQLLLNLSEVGYYLAIILSVVVWYIEREKGFTSGEVGTRSPFVHSARRGRIFVVIVRE